MQPRTAIKLRDRIAPTCLLMFFISFTIFLLQNCTKYIILDSMNITKHSPDKVILRELGRRLASLRKQHGLTQIQISQEAGIGVATLRRIESGKDGQMETWLKILKVLDLVHTIDAVIPPVMKSPMEEALGKSKRRNSRNSPSEVIWGDEKS